MYWVWFVCLKRTVSRFLLDEPFIADADAMR